MTQGLKFNNVQRPQGQSPVIRVQGVDTPNPSFGQTLQSGREINLPDITDEKFAEVQQAQQETFAAIAEANRAQAEADIADLKARGHSPQGQKLGGLVSEIANTVNIIEKRKLKRAEAEAKIQEQVQKKRRAELENVARSELQREISDFQRTVRESGLEQGIDKLRREGTQVINSFKGQLAPNQIEELQETLHSELNRTQQDLTSRRLEQMEQVRDTQNQIKTEEIMTSLSADIAKIKATDDPRRVKQLIKSTLKRARELAPDKASEPNKFANVYLPLLERVRTAADSSTEAIAQTNQKIKQTQDYAKEASKVYEQYNAGEISGDTLRFRLRQIAESKGVPELAGNVFSTNLERYKQEIDRLETFDKMRRLTESDESPMSRDLLNQYTEVQVGRLVHSYLMGDTQTQMTIDQAIDSGRGKVLGNIIKRQVKTAKQDRAEFLQLQEDTLGIMADISEQKIDNRNLIFSEEFIPDPQYDETAQRLIIPDKSEAVRAFASANNISTREARNILSTFVKRKQNLVKRMSTLKNKWANKGINIENLEDTSGLAEQEEAIKPLIEEVKRQPEPQRNSFQMRGANIPNPNSGATARPNTPTVAPLAKSDDGVFIRPFGKEDEKKVTVTSGYGMRTHPVYGNQSLHNGVDYAAPRGTNVKTIQGGRVVFNKWITGFGKTVAVRTPDGRTEMFAHLDDWDVQTGQEIPPGTTIGKLGNTGVGTGAHLHFQVWKGEPVWGGRSAQHAATINPAQYLREVKQQTAEPRGQGAPPNQKMPGGDAVVGTQGGRNREVREQHNAGNPMRARKLASARKSHYPSKNDLNSNYGYDALKNDPDFAKKLNQVSNEIGIPGQWLADLIAHETDGSFRTDIQSYDPDVDSVGLIQFTDATARRMGLSGTEDIARMDRVEQMEWVRKYLDEFKGQIKSVNDLVAAVYGGAPLFRAQDRSLPSGRYKQYLRQMGRFVGREYNYNFDRSNRSSQKLHSRAVEGCSQCNQMLEKNGFIVEHYAS